MNFLLLFIIIEVQLYILNLFNNMNNSFVLCRNVLFGGCVGAVFGTGVNEFNKKIYINNLSVDTYEKLVKLEKLGYSKVDKYKYDLKNVIIHKMEYKQRINYALYKRVIKHINDINEQKYIDVVIPVILGCTTVYSSTKCRILFDILNKYGFSFSNFRYKLFVNILIGVPLFMYAHTLYNYTNMSYIKANTENLDDYDIYETETVDFGSY